MSNLLDRDSTYHPRVRKIVVASLKSFAKQCQQGFVEATAVAFPQSYRGIKQVVVCGMGGSTLGTHVLQSAFQPSLKVPLTIMNDYHLPGFVSGSTVVLLSSYSGNTEEVLSAGREARRRGAKVTGLSQGGKLAQFFRRTKLPWYRIDGSLNPAGQPRMGLGYSTMGQVGLLTTLGALAVTPRSVQSLVAFLELRAEQLDPSVPTARNAAKQVAVALAGRMPVLVGSGHLTGSMHAFANQLNETAKTFALWFALPELNHHLLEGLRYPKVVRRATFVFANSSLTEPRIRTRQHITRRIAEQRGVRTLIIPLQGRDSLMQAFELLTIAGYSSFYLSVLNDVNPLSIATVDEFKRLLARHL